MAGRQIRGQPPAGMKTVKAAIPMSGDRRICCFQKARKEKFRKMENDEGGPIHLSRSFFLPKKKGGDGGGL